MGECVIVKMRALCCDCARCVSVHLCACEYIYSCVRACERVSAAAARPHLPAFRPFAAREQRRQPAGVAGEGGTRAGVSGLRRRQRRRADFAL